MRENRFLPIAPRNHISARVQDHNFGEANRIDAIVSLLETVFVVAVLSERDSMSGHTQKRHRQCAHVASPVGFVGRRVCKKGPTSRQRAMVRRCDEFLSTNNATAELYR